MLLLLKLPYELLQLILEYQDSRSDINALIRTCRYLYNTFNAYLYQYDMKHHRRSALFFAANRGIAATAAHSLRAGPYTEVWDWSNNTLMMVAAINNHTSVVSQILKAADIELVVDLRRWYRIPLSDAACHASLKTVKLLLDHGAKIEPQNPDWRSPLILAATNGHYGSAKVLLECGAAVGAKDRNGRTALAWAAEQGRLDVVDLLLEYGAEVDSATVIDTTPLVLAAKNGHDEIVERLLEVGADPNVRSSTGWTCLHFAASQRPHISVIKRLLEAGSDPTAIVFGNFRTGATPADLAHPSGTSTAITKEIWKLEEIYNLLNAAQRNARRVL
ncbi:ankyrin repeat domain-containing protein [Aspergillus mulundensis]|uniref:Uncharacterized protein n=1 Tax=Aspergillus mulundensis TaxID=1810919 RepID=A0A3D8QNS9_9EURO|nr:hypothetical protein DSM5745_10225 [Aspergillus mulundensis]RDW63114.1 hypothetical protein DSM5745_10225 [Aspergillus mulundensis]